MKISNQALIQELKGKTERLIQQAEQFQNENLETLNWKSDEENWSILECIEHLNRYSDFYIPEISKRIQTAKKASSESIFKSGMLGNYFAELMKPKEKLNKMKTLKPMNPVGSILEKATLEKFIRQQNEMLDLFQLAQNVDLTKTKNNISISKIIKLRLGDTLRFVVYHNERHMKQAQDVLNKQSQLAANKV